jgi:hypothetical protein
VQIVSAKADGFYDGVGMQRTMLLVRDARLSQPVVVDVYRLTSSGAQDHTYDYPIHFRGQLIATNVKYAAHAAEQRALGTAAGYQHIWNESAGSTDSTVRLTWLTGSRYYSVTTASAPNTSVIFGRTGAGDPNFNLISEPLVIVRRRAADHVFASVIEPHGYFSEREERSADARGRVQQVRVLGSSAEATVVEVTGAQGLRWVVMINNGAPSTSARHRVTFAGQIHEWVGNFAVQGIQ